MILYGIPKLQVSLPSVFTATPTYKLSTMGAAVVAASSGGIFAVASTYV